MNFFDSAYKDGIPPWDIGRPQREIIRLAENGEISGRVLDAGCGTGENALYLASGITINFLVSDALKLQLLRDKFDTVIDCGLFHVFSDEERLVYAASLSSALNPGGKFDKGWRINYIRAAEFETMFSAESVKAWLSSITRS